MDANKNKTGRMQTVKLVIGIISIVSSMIILFQSCAVGMINGLQKNTTDLSGSAGVLVAFAMLIAGIVAIAMRNKNSGEVAVGLIYIVAALIGFFNGGTYGDLVIWSIVSAVFALVFLVPGAAARRSRIRE